MAWGCAYGMPCCPLRCLGNATYSLSMLALPKVSRHAGMSAASASTKLQLSKSLVMRWWWGKIERRAERI